MSNEALAKYTDELVTTQRKMAELKAFEADLKAKIRELVAGPGSLDVAGHALTLSPNRRLNLAKIAADFPAEQHPELYEQALATAKVRRLFSPEQVDRYMEETGDLKVTVR